MNAATFEERRFPARAMMARCFSDACSSLPRTHTHSTTQRLSVCHSHCHCQSVNSTLPSPTHAPSTGNIERRDSSSSASSSSLSSRPPSRLRPRLFSLASKSNIDLLRFVPSFVVFHLIHPSFLPVARAHSAADAALSFIHFRCRPIAVGR